MVRDKRVLLINPQSPFLLDERVFPPLGILYVAASLREKGYDVQVLDLAGKPDMNVSVAWDYDAIGITATTPQLPKAFEILRAIKRMSHRKRTMLGGPHASVDHNRCEREDICKTSGPLEEFDKIVVGDGEQAVVEAIEDFSPRKFIHASSLEQLVKDIDTIPFPARDLIDLHSYRYKVDGRSATTIMTQRGCPFQCGFCCGRELPIYRKARMRSVENVMREFDEIHDRWDFSAFMIYDDEFNLRKDRTLELCEGLSKRDYWWRSFIKAELFTDEIARAMAKAGCKEVLSGVESGSAKILKIIHKNTTPEINANARMLAKKYGMKFKALMSMGHPDESAGDVQQTKEWLLTNRPDEFDLTVITPYPGSPYFDFPERYEGKLFFKRPDFSKQMAFYKGIPGEYTSFVSTPHLSPQEIVALRDQIEAEVREALSIPYPSGPAAQYDHSMGQTPLKNLQPSSEPVA